MSGGINTMTHAGVASSKNRKELPLSLYHLLNTEALPSPFPLYCRVLAEALLYWHPFLHTWVVPRYADVITVLQHFSASRTPTPDQLIALGLNQLTPLAEVLVRQMLFLDPPAHGRIRT